MLQQVGVSFGTMTMVKSRQGEASYSNHKSKRNEYTAGEAKL